jgi:hypothetical protein
MSFSNSKNFFHQKNLHRKIQISSLDYYESSGKKYAGNIIHVVNMKCDIYYILSINFFIK